MLRGGVGRGGGAGQTMINSLIQPIRGFGCSGMIRPVVKGNDRTVQCGGFHTRNFYISTKGSHVTDITQTKSREGKSYFL